MPVDKKTLQLVDAPTEAPAWPGIGKQNAEPVQRMLRRQVKGKRARTFSRCGHACYRICSAKVLSTKDELLTELDSKAGDGDLGTSMAWAALAVKRLPDEALG